MHTIPISSLEIKPKDIARFWSKVAKSEDLFSCWEWQDGKSDGYGQFKLDGRMLRANRFAWFLTNGPIPEDFLILHKCDNKSCVHPSHLYLGDSRDNALDSIREGTWAIQELSVNQVKEIKERLTTEETHAQIAEEFGVHRTTISLIYQGRNWSHI